jgi:hypothetical protein
MYNCAEFTDIYTVGNLVGIVAYTVQQCIDACSSMNNVTRSSTCVAVAINNALWFEYEKNGANCFLQNVTGPKMGNLGVTVAVLIR